MTNLITFEYLKYNSYSGQFSIFQGTHFRSVLKRLKLCSFFWSQVWKFLVWTRKSEKG